MDLVRFGMDAAELVQKIKDLGTDFEPTDEYLAALRKAGAQEAVIQALRQKPKPSTKEQVGKLLMGGVSSQRGAALVRQRGIDFDADEGYLETLRVAGADETLIESLRAASAAVAVSLEEGRLEEVRNRLAQIESLNHARGLTSHLQKAAAGDEQAEALADKLRKSDEAFDRWRESEWVPDLADRKRGNLLSTMDDGRAMFCCDPPGSKRVYWVEAPAKTRWRILTEGMRVQIANLVEIDKFLRSRAGENALLTLYRGVWQEARDMYCKDAPGTKYTDLNGQEQACSKPVEAPAQ
jgi:hypothetical protein